jgi:two-component system C4-dicarboxylate transport sensor histidine kinase DctB
LATAFDAEYNRAVTTAKLYAESLRGAIDRRRYLPKALAIHPDLRTITRQNSDNELTGRVNNMLEGLAQSSQAEAIYVMDQAGLTIAASNWRQPDTFLGHSYNFRPYFLEAIAGQPSSAFAIGATTGRPGAFVSEPIRDAAGIPSGVVVVKIDLVGLEKSWIVADQHVLVSNSDGVVVLSSKPSWKYGTLAPLTKAQREAIALGKQFANESLAPLPISERTQQSITIDGERFVQATLNMGWRDWRLHLLTSYGVLQRQAWLAVLFTISGLTAIALFLAIMRSERFKSALMLSQSEREELDRLNADLNKEVQERRQAELQLRAAQVELKKTATLAALGQLAASVSHELGQPLSAMKTYLSGIENLIRDGSPVDRDAIARLQRLTERMNETTLQLKFFARRGGEPMKSVDLRDVVSGALETVQPSLSTANIELDLELPGQPLTVQGGRNRLEQVLINLLRNAVQAVENTDKRLIKVWITLEDEAIRCHIADSGNGFDDEIKDQIFDPFVTTRASGEGMGLGLAISASIIQEHGGRISASNSDLGGAEFVVCLPRLKPDEAAT